MQRQEGNNENFWHHECANLTKRLLVVQANLERVGEECHPAGSRVLVCGVALYPGTEEVFNIEDELID